MNRNKRRTHQPKNAQCKTCRHKEADCSGIAFERMPTGSKTSHGITLVDCSCYQPTQQANAHVMDAPEAGITTSAAMSKQQQESRAESRRVNEAGETAAEPFTAQPEIQALALVMAALTGEAGTRHARIVSIVNARRASNMLHALLYCATDVIFGEEFDIQYPKSMLCSATRSQHKPQAPVSERISKLLDTFIRAYPETELSLSAAEVTALAYLRDFYSKGANSGVVAFVSVDVLEAVHLWLDALGLSNIFPQLRERIIGNSLRIEAHTSIAQGLASPGSDIKLPDLDGTHSATLAKLVNDILRQTNTKGHTFHSAAGAFLRIEG